MMIDTAADPQADAAADFEGVPVNSRIIRYRVRFWDAVLSGALAGIVFIAFYYATLWLVPTLNAGAGAGGWGDALVRRHWGGALFYGRFDLAQYFGSFIDPPYPSPTTWFIGIALLFGSLIALGWVYALLLSWSLRPSTVCRGIGFGVAMFVVLGFAIGLAFGYHPAVMRYALPDTGFYFLGWSGWATLQFLIICVVYGAVVGRVYGRE